MIEDYYKTDKGADEYIKMAEGINGNLLIQKFKNFLPPNSQILEIGSGPGSDWEILNKYFEVTGSDNSVPFLNRLNIKFPNADFSSNSGIQFRTPHRKNIKLNSRTRMC